MNEKEQIECKQGPIETAGSFPLQKLVSKARILYVNPDLLVQLLLTANQNDYISLPVSKNAPDDLQVGEIHYVFERGQFGIKLMSKHFDVVPKGHIIPEIQLEFETVKIPKKFKKKKTC